jgi:hypothetical protein
VEVVVLPAPLGVFLGKQPHPPPASAAALRLQALVAEAYSETSQQQVASLAVNNNNRQEPPLEDCLALLAVLAVALDLHLQEDSDLEIVLLVACSVNSRPSQVVCLAAAPLPVPHHSHLATQLLLVEALACLVAVVNNNNSNSHNSNNSLVVCLAVLLNKNHSLVVHLEALARQRLKASLLEDCSALPPIRVEAVFLATTPLLAAALERVCSVPPAVQQVLQCLGASNSNSRSPVVYLVEALSEPTSQVLAEVCSAVLGQTLNNRAADSRLAMLPRSLRQPLCSATMVHSNKEDFLANPLGRVSLAHHRWPNRANNSSRTSSSRLSMTPTHTVRHPSGQACQCLLRKLRSHSSRRCQQLRR